MNGQTMIHPYNGILLNNKKKQTINIYNMNESQKSSMLSEKSQTKKIVLSDSTYVGL